VAGGRPAGRINAALRAIGTGKDDTHLPAASAGRRRQEKASRGEGQRPRERRGRKKKLVGEVGEGYKEGGSHLLPPLFLSPQRLPNCSLD
jgi:hypothetical protein